MNFSPLPSSPPSAAPVSLFPPVSLSACISLSASFQLFSVPRLREALAGSGFRPLLPPSPQAPSQVPHAFQQLNEDRDISVCLSVLTEVRLGGTLGGGSWEKPSGYCRGGYSSDFPALLSLLTPMSGGDRPLGWFSTQLSLRGPLLCFSSLPLITW